VQIVRRLAKQDRKVGIFCNISLASLADETFFPQFLEFLQANKDLAGALIFELGQAAFDDRGAVEARHMARWPAWASASASTRSPTWTWTSRTWPAPT
jgi:cyclic-di-GMP phosphodiesterase TipF (flagellum assembly factor)